MTAIATVAVVHTTPGRVLDDYVRLLRLVMPSAPAAPALLWWAAPRRYPFPGASPPPWQLDGVLRALRAAGVAELCAPVPCEADYHGYGPLLRAAQVRPLDGPAAARHPSPAQLTGTLLVLLAPPGGALLALAGLRAAGGRPAPDATLDWLRATCAGVIGLVDATTAICGGRPVVRDTLLGSDDPLALDTAAARLLGADLAGSPPRHRPFELVGDTMMADEPWPAPPGSATQRAFRGATTRWTPAEQATFASWLSDTGWGRLFREYQRATLPA